jgi:DNA-binding MarR family transcriptional regulator
MLQANESVERHAAATASDAELGASDAELDASLATSPGQVGGSDGAPTQDTSALDAQIAELFDALRVVLLAGRRHRHGVALDKGAMTVLYMIEQRQPARASDLVGCTGLDASTLSRHVKALSDLGYVKHLPDPADARARLLSLSPAGETTLVQIRAARAATGRRALGDWTEQDLTQLTALLRRLGAAIDIED